MRIQRLILWGSILCITACPKPTVEPPVDNGTPKVRPMPDSLPTPEFKAPTTETRTLSNGLEVIVASNHEVPLWDVRIAFNVGGHLDPAKKAGLASITFSMMNEGAGERDSEAISRELKRMASSVRAGAGAVSKDADVESSLKTDESIVAAASCLKQFAQAVQKELSASTL